MDATAIMMAKEEEIQVLGLTQKGDILALRAFCKQNSETTNEERTEKKRKLLETLKSKLPRSKTFKRKVESISESLPVKVPCRKISIGWQHFDVILQFVWGKEERQILVSHFVLQKMTY